MQWLANISVRRPVFATVLMLGICVLGLAGYGQLGVDRFPKIDAPFITVITRLPGAAPEEVETEVTDKIEEARQHHQRHRRAALDLQRGRLAGLPHLQAGEERRRRRAGGARQGQPGACPSCPRDVEPPVVSKIDPGATPVLYVALNGKLAGRAR